jgi:putative oxidoreductase
MTTTAPTTRRPANIALWVLQVALAAFYALGAVPKVLGDPTVLDGFAAIGWGPTGTLVIGVLELAGAVGLLVPRLCGLAALGFVGLMAGAVAFTVSALGVAAAALPAVLLVLVGLLAWARWDRTAALVAMARR